MKPNKVMTSINDNSFLGFLSVWVSLLLNVRYIELAFHLHHRFIYFMVLEKDEKNEFTKMEIFLMCMSDFTTQQSISNQLCDSFT